MKSDTGLVSITPSKVAATAVVTRSTTLLPKPYPQGVAMFNVTVVPVTLDWTPFTTSWTSLTTSKPYFDIVLSRLFE